VERNRLLPDISLGYFNGTNQYEGSQNYQGFLLGLSVPLFFGEQKARINANKIAVDINENMQAYYVSATMAKYTELAIELKKYQQSLDMYNNSGKELSEEIIRSSQKSYEVGEIDFFRFVMSIENALKLTVDYLDNVSKYNQVALEINYLNR
jgi:cobalt-zinc-cadmium resistance protein CzcA